MKTRKQKVICRVLCMVVSILLLASFFVAPVSAEVDELTQVTISNILYNYGMGEGGNYDDDYRPFSNLSFFTFVSNRLDLLDNRASDRANHHPTSILTNRTSMLYEANFENEENYLFGVYYINQLFDDFVLRKFSKGDTIFIDSGTIPIYIYSGFRITNFRFTIRYLGDPFEFYYGSVAASTQVIPCNLDDTSPALDFERLYFTFYDDVEASDLCLCFEFNLVDTSDDIELEIEEFDVSFRFGPGVSPNYPIYPSAPGGNEIGGLGSAEEELLGSQQGGIDEGVSAMDNVGSALSNLDSGKVELLAFSTELMSILDRIGSIPGIQEIVEISLALGLFASLMALSASIVSAADRRAGQAKREAQRDARKK